MLLRFMGICTSNYWFGLLFGEHMQFNVMTSASSFINVPTLVSIIACFIFIIIIIITHMEWMYNPGF